MSPIKLILVFFTNFYFIPPSLSYETIPYRFKSLPQFLSSSSLSSSIQTFNVQYFGARNDGKTDATKAFLNAWDSACNSRVPSIIYVPKGNYLLGPLKFEGISCRSPIMFQIDGTLVADLNIVSKYQTWIIFHEVDGLTIKGGVLNAKGIDLWNCKAAHQNCPKGATSLSFDNSQNIVVDGLTSVDSQMYHITLNACQRTTIQRITILADGNSPNTDGIHIERSTGIQILNSAIKTGDDCISIGLNNQHILIQGISCGPGHGISIGSLGRESDEGVVVQDVTVKSVTFKGTENGFRIKTFSTPIKGTVKNINFIGAYMDNVRNPIIIDQNYCPHNTCPYGQGSGIQISNVVFSSIHGTSASDKALTLDCSSRFPCVGLTLHNINLNYHSNIPKCQHQNAFGKILGYMQPPHCLLQ